MLSECERKEWKEGEKKEEEPVSLTHSIVWKRKRRRMGGTMQRNIKRRKEEGP